MKVCLSSVAGDPRDPRTWSNAPAHLFDVLESMGHAVTAIDSSRFSWFEKSVMAAENVLSGLPWNAISWFAAARCKRAQHVAGVAHVAGCDLVICTGTLDAPVGLGVDYAVWLDNTFALLQRSAVALPYSPATVAEIERLEVAALQGARVVLPFSEHVAHSIVQDYGVPPERVHVVGCGSGPLKAYDGEKAFAKGHLLFVAKHLFSSKGGDLLLEAFRKVRTARPQTKLVLIGNEEARSKAEGIDGVEVHGYVDRDVLDGFFYEASMLVQPMFADPWGQVYLEAMKARAVVVALDVAALPELTDERRLGVLIEEPDAQKLANAVLETYARPQKELDRLTREAQQRVAELYSWEAVGRRIAAAVGLNGS